jgi:hypothetical protein
MSNDNEDRQVILTTDNLQTSGATLHAISRQTGLAVTFAASHKDTWTDYVASLMEMYAKGTKWTFHERIGLVTPTLFAYSNAVQQFTKVADGSWIEPLHLSRIMPSET